MAKREERTRGIVEAIARHQAVHGLPPSIRATELASTSDVAHWLAVCASEGLITRVTGLARAITLTSEGRALVGSPPESESRTKG